MKASTQFNKMYYKLSPLARRNLFVYYNGIPISLVIVNFEINQKTKFGKVFLTHLGFANK